MLNMIAAQNSNKKYNPEPFTNELITVTKAVRDYSMNTIDFFRLSGAIDVMNLESKPVREHLTAQQVNSFLREQDDLREKISYLAFAKDLDFPRVGYTFLYFYIFLLLLIQLFAHAESIPLQLVFIFSLSSVLVFFSQIIRDLDSPFKWKYPTFTVDVMPLTNCMESLKQSVDVYNKHEK